MLVLLKLCLHKEILSYMPRAVSQTCPSVEQPWELLPLQPEAAQPSPSNTKSLFTCVQELEIQTKQPNWVQNASWQHGHECWQELRAHPGINTGTNTPCSRDTQLKPQHETLPLVQFVQGFQTAEMEKGKEEKKENHPSHPPEGAGEASSVS